VFRPYWRFWSKKVIRSKVRGFDGRTGQSWFIGRGEPAQSREGQTNVQYCFLASCCTSLRRYPFFESHKVHRYEHSTVPENWRCKVNGTAKLIRRRTLALLKRSKRDGNLFQKRIKRARHHARMHATTPDCLCGHYLVTGSYCHPFTGKHQ
jgi:hypothetical protein